MKFGKLSATGILAFSIALAAPAAAQAQNCLGFPIANQKAAASVNVAFPENAKSYGVSGRLRLDGPLSVGASYSFSTIDNVDPKLHSFGVNAAYELPLSAPASICGFVGAEHGSITLGDMKTNSLQVPVGAAIGKSLSVGDDAELVPYAMPHLLWIRESFSFDGGPSISDSATEFGLNLGATYRIQKILLNAGVHLNSIENDKATFGVGVGYAF